MEQVPVRQLATAMAQLLRARLDNLSAETVTLSRDEAALLLGLADGIAEYMAARDTSEYQ